MSRQLNLLGQVSKVLGDVRVFTLENHAFERILDNFDGVIVGFEEAMRAVNKGKFVSSKPQHSCRDTSLDQVSRRTTQMLLSSASNEQIFCQVYM